jgi:hypothetical protein
MHRVSLLFGTAQNFLGEVLTRDGGFERVLLNADGEEVIGVYVNDWQLRGIPIVREVMQQGNRRVFYQERIPIRSHEFETALDRWGMTHGTITIVISDMDVRTWEQMLRLPFEDAERFSMIVVMRVAPEADRAEWHASVDAVVKALETNDPSSKKKMLALRKKAAGDLVKTFEKAKA